MIRDYKLGNVDYVAFRAESTHGTPTGIPNIFAKVQEIKWDINPNKDDDTRLSGHTGKRSDLHNGLISIEGELDVYATSEMKAHILKMMYYNGSSPLSEEEPTSYTFDTAINGRLLRVSGVQISETEVSYEEGENNVAHFKSKLNAEKYFWDARVDSVSGSGSTEITLKTDQGQTPNALFQVGDKITIWDESAGSEVEGTVTSISGGTKVTVSEDLSGLVENDTVYLKDTVASGATIGWMSEGNTAKWETFKLYKYDGSAYNEICSLPDTSLKLIHEIEETRCSGSRTPSLKNKQVDLELTMKTYLGKDNRLAQFFDNTQGQWKAVWSVDGVAILTVEIIGKMSAGEPERVSGELETQTLTIVPVYDSSTSIKFFSLS